MPFIVQINMDTPKASSHVLPAAFASFLRSSHVLLPKNRAEVYVMLVVLAPELCANEVIPSGK